MVFKAVGVAERPARAHGEPRRLEGDALARRPPSASRSVEAWK